MAIINFLAQWWGFSIIAISIAFLINPKSLKTAYRWAEDEKTLTLIGVIGVMLGIAFVLAYNTWDGTWKTAISLLAWITIIKGLSCLLMPEQISKFIAKYKDKTDLVQMFLMAGVIIGCIIIYIGFTI